MRALILSLALLAGPAAAQDLTRAEVAKLSPHDLAVRVLGDLGQKGEAKELKFYVSPVAPTPPWLEQVAVDFPLRWLDSHELCEQNRIIVDFAPHDMDARSHMFDAKYDPPTFIEDVEKYSRFAHSSTRDCKAIPLDSYFTAEWYGEAEQALDAFGLYRDAVAKHGSVLKCVDYTDDKQCSDSSFAAVTAFLGVKSIQEDRRPGGSIVRTIVLKLSPGKNGEDRELWLTESFGGGTALSRAELRNLYHPPVF